VTVLSHQDQELIRKLASNWRLTPATMMNHISKGQWIAAPWLQYCSAIVAQEIARGGARIIISAPPRHGKTELISIGTSAWVLENFPRHNVILTCYGADLAEQSGRRVRDMLTDNEDQFRCRVRSDVRRVNAFLTETDGYMFSIGVGGAITGRGAHVLMVDDYIKEIKEALSPTYRDYIWNWFATTARTRLEPGASIIIIATRWHSDDLIGRIIKAFPGRWMNLVFPAEAEEADLIGRQPGEALFPERFPIAALQELRVDLGSTFYEAMFQQHPVDETRKIANGNWLKRVDILPTNNRMKWIRVWDLAATEDGGDFSAGALCAWERETDRFFIANMVRRQFSPQQVEDMVRRTAVSDGQSTEVGIEQEPGSAGKSLVEHYARNVLPEFKVTPIPVVKHKIIRAQPFLAAAEAGRVFMVSGVWNDPFVKEVDAFPSGDYDDQVDTVSAAYVKLTGKRVFSATWGQNLANSGSFKPKQKAEFSLRSAVWGSN
jgi:predicted phage terminase large subunit-like protein